MNDPRFPGHCFVCGEPTHDIVKKIPAGSPIAGEPERLGRAHDDVVRCNLVLVSGKTMTVTVHERCTAALSADLPRHWKTILGAFAHEDKTRAYRRVAPRTPEQQRIWDELLLGLAADVPLGVLSVESWKDIAA